MGEAILETVMFFISMSVVTIAVLIVTGFVYSLFTGKEK